MPGAEERRREWRREYMREYDKRPDRIAYMREYRKAWYHRNQAQQGKQSRTMTEIRAALVATEHPTTLDIAWAAGIYEGEGSCRGPQAQVGQKDRWLLDRLRALFGGCISPNSANGMFQWTVHGARARGFLMTVYKFLSPRRQAQVKKVLGDTISLEQT